MTSQRKKFDMAGAEAFAQLSPIQSACYHYMTDNFSEHHKITLRNYFMPVLLLQGIKPKYSPPHRRLRKVILILTKPTEPINMSKYFLTFVC